MKTWALIVAVKPLSAAKSRLDLSSRLREDLALAMLEDTLVAVSGVPGIGCLIVTDDPRAAAVASAAGMTVRSGEPPGGLNVALTYGVLAARQLWGDVRVAALPADLPALRAEELGEALAAASHHDRGFVTDEDADGTTLLCARRTLQPSYGKGSASRHRVGGAVMLEGNWPGLRRDVDTLIDLAAAVSIGVGSHTAAMHASLS